MVCRPLPQTPAARLRLCRAGAGTNCTIPAAHRAVADGCGCGRVGQRVPAAHCSAASVAEPHHGHIGGVGLGHGGALLQVSAAAAGAPPRAPHHKCHVEVYFWARDLAVGSTWGAAAPGAHLVWGRVCVVFDVVVFDVVVVCCAFSVCCCGCQGTMSFSLGFVKDSPRLPAADG